jgi:hypothetical protein
MVAGQPVFVQSPARNKLGTSVRCGGLIRDRPGRTENTAS